MRISSDWKRVFLSIFIGIIFLVLLFLYLLNSSKTPVKKYTSQKQAISYPSDYYCTKYANEIGVQTHPLIESQEGINDQLNYIAQSLSADQPIGTTSNVESLAKQYSPDKLPVIQKLEHQYNDLSEQIASVKAKYQCTQ